MLGAYAEKIAREEFRPAGFGLRLGLKDVELALDAAASQALAMPIASVLRDRFVEAIDAGRGDDDWSSVARHGRGRARGS